MNKSDASFSDICGKSLFGKSWVSVSAYEIDPHGDENHGL